VKKGKIAGKEKGRRDKLLTIKKSGGQTKQEA